MALPLIKTKFNSPLLRHSHVSRMRLKEFLTREFRQGEVFTRRLTLISAPAGYGKSTLAADWLKSLDIQTAWLSLDEGDNDPVRFLSYVVHAIRQVLPEVGNAALGMLQSPKLPPPEMLLTPLLNEIDGRRTPLILVIDDYHLINNASIHPYLAFLIEYQPQQMHTVIASREDPPLALHRMRARGQLLEVRQENITFSMDETIDFLDKALEQRLSANNIEAIRQRTEGWVTGMQLLALSLRKQVDANTFIQTFTGSDRFVLDYLFEEVFNLQTEDVQEFLIKTSILDHLSAGVCEAVTGREDSGELLRQLDQANMFILPVDQTETWYRYHHLFLDLLRQRLRVQKDVCEQELHSKASQWYQNEGYLEKAVHHALAGKEWERSAGLIEEASDLLLKQGAVTTVIRWFRMVPLVVIHGDPHYCLTYAWPLLLVSMVKEADELLCIAERTAGENQVLLGEIAAAQAFSEQVKGNEAHMVERSELALSLLPKTDLSSRGVVAMNLGIAYWHSGEMEKTEEVLQEALSIFQQTDNKYGEVTSLFFLGRVYGVRGQLGRLCDYMKRITGLPLRIPIMVLAHLDLGLAAYEVNDLKACEEHLEKGLEILGPGGNQEFLIGVLMQKVRLKLAQHDTEAALEVMQRIKKIGATQKIPQRTQARLDGYMVEIAIVSGDLKQADRLVEQTTACGDAHSFYRFLNLSRIRLLMAKGKMDAASRLLEKMCQQVQQMGWGYGLIVVRIMQALTALDNEAAVKYLSDALTLAKEDKFIRSFVDQGGALVPLLREAARRGVTPAYVGEILAAFEAEGDAGLPDHVEALSKREMEVLRLLAAGMTNAQIAEQLVVSVSTVKSHVHHICGKLGAENRTQAVVCAQEFGIL